MSVLDFALSLAGLPQATIEALDKDLPGLARIAAGAREAEPFLTAAKPHLDALEPLATQLWPIMQRIYPDIVAVTPTVEKLIDFANWKEHPTGD
jgi:hypothetical protein